MYNHEISARRSALRQRETENILRGIYELEENVPRDKVTQYLSMLILRHLLDTTHSFTISGDGDVVKIRQFFHAKLIVAVENFAGNIEEEQRVILGNLLQILISRLVDPIRQAYAMLESEHPEEAYPGPVLHEEA